MKKIFTIIVVLSLCVGSILNITGCSAPGGGEEFSKKAMVFVIGNTANSSGVNLDPKIGDTVYSIIRGGGFIGAVDGDGSPKVIIAQEFALEERYKSASEERLKRDATQKKSRVLDTLNQIKANDPEVDAFGALKLAARTLVSASGDYSTKEIYVVSTGLNTTGVLSFQNNLLIADAQTLVEELRKRNELPELSGINIRWAQLGDVEAPQKALTSNQRQRLTSLYKAIVEASGGTWCEVPVVPGPAPDLSSYPYVTPIEFPDEEPISFESASMSADNAFAKPVLLTETRLRFVPDEETFLDEQGVQNTLKPIAVYLQEHPDTDLVLVGTTAGDVNTQNAVSLSNRRAKAVKDALISIGGIETQRITAVGLGCEDPWHVKNAGLDGPLASLNRKVVILDANSAEAKEIVSRG